MAEKIVQKIDDAKRQEAVLRGSYTEIYECDLKAGRLQLMARDADVLRTIEYTGSFSRDIDTMVKAGLHPDDVRTYKELYDADRLLALFKSGQREVVGEYRRMGQDGHYRWVLATVVPAEDWSVREGKVMILIKDITQYHHLLEEQKKMESRFHFLFRRSFDLAMEVNLQTGVYTRIISSPDGPLYALPESGEYVRLSVGLTERNVMPEDIRRIKEDFSLDALRKASKQGGEVVGRYRSSGEGGMVLWTECRAFFVDGEPFLAVVTARDITANMENDLKISMAEQYDIALRKIYDELYELNMTRDHYRIVYHTHGKYVTPPDEGVLTETIPLVAERMIYPEDKERFLQFFDLRQVRGAFASGRESMIGEFRKLWKDGEFHWASLTLFPVRQEEGGDEVYLCFIMDIGDKKKADEIAEQNRLLRRQQIADARYRVILEKTGTLVFERNKETGELYAPQQAGEVLEGNYDGKRSLFTVWMEDGVVHPEDIPALEKIMDEIDEEQKYSEITLRLLSKQGEYRWYKVSQTCLMNEKGETARVIATVNDVDEVTKSQEELRYRAEYDLLTGIHNMQTFYACAQQIMQENLMCRYAVIRMDINRFKYINDLYGMDEGDRLLQYIARVLRECVPEGSAYGRMESDVFCICTAYEDEGELEELARRITQKLREYNLGYRILPYFGICLVDSPDAPVSILCDWANLALRTVKGNMLKNVAYYDDKLRAKQLDEQKIEEEMQDALRDGQFVAYFQPKHDIRTGHIVGAEALARWIHPREGLLAPFRFIPLFERNGFIVRMDEYIWEQTFQRLRAWMDQGNTAVPVSLNVSRIHIYNPGFHDKLMALMDRYHIPAELVELELTESTFVENPQVLYEKMGSLQSRGIRFSMDDFGAGYSSLNMLKDAMVNTIKLDKGFLDESVATEKGKTVITYMVTMAKKLHLQVVPEGVETKEEADFLLGAGCDIAQGFYFSRPMPTAEFEKKLREDLQTQAAEKA